ncbi:hypothetical protein BGZ54_010364 [Gamsiella multidivaricata]|nr:hypothetical protein BGZ54_010364 [Gamsiella multidivaricata]
MLEVVCNRRVRKRSSTATVTNRRLWACVVRSWEKVTPECVRDYFVQVPILFEYQKIGLLGLGVETKADQVNRLQEEFKERYAGNKETIADQKVSSAPNYLSMINSEGSSQGTFQQLKENDFVDEDNSEDSDNDTWGDDDKFDLDYEYPEPVVSDQEMQAIEITLRNRTVEKEVPMEGFSSPPSSPYAEEVYS